MNIRKRKPINDITKNLVVKLYSEDDMTCDEIAKTCNISKSSVFRIVKQKFAQVQNLLEYK